MRPQTSALLAAAAAAAAWLLYKKKKKRRVVITGCCGNLGRKLGAYLQERGVEVVGIEHPDYCSRSSEPPCDRVVQGDAQQPHAGGVPWRRVLAGADAVVHFSAVNPYPNANWAESSGSMDHAFNVALAAADAGVPRFILASSNHVMGGYKDDHKHGVVKPSDAPRVGTALNDPAAAQRAGDAVAYAAAKLAAERLLAALAHVRPRTVFLALRVGWCQPGINSPRTIGASGVPPAFETAGAAASVKDDSHDDAWFRGMWLSNQDFLRLFGAAVLSDSVPRSGYHCVNAMSANTNARWSLDETEALLGVRPRDDAASYRDSGGL